MLKVQDCRFELSAFSVDDAPRGPGPMIVFLGRSNVGKSSLINRLLGRQGLARTSSRPGRTQSVNFYRVNGELWFVDLPGYGYAKVPEAVRASWGPMVEAFLDRFCERIALALVVVDARREPTESDSMMHEWLKAREVAHLTVATKIDKLSASGRAAARRTLGEAVLPVSAASGVGLGVLWRRIDDALASVGPGRGRVADPDQSGVSR